LAERRQVSAAEPIERPQDQLHWLHWLLGSRHSRRAFGHRPDVGRLCRRLWAISRKADGEWIGRKRSEPGASKRVATRSRIWWRIGKRLAGEFHVTDFGGEEQVPGLGW